MLAPHSFAIRKNAIIAYAFSHRICIQILNIAFVVDDCRDVNAVGV